MPKKKANLTSVWHYEREVLIHDTLLGQLLPCLSRLSRLASQEPGTPAEGGHAQSIQMTMVAWQRLQASALSLLMTAVPHALCEPDVVWTQWVSRPGNELLLAEDVWERARLRFGERVNRARAMLAGCAEAWVALGLETRGCADPALAVGRLRDGLDGLRRELAAIALAGKGSTP